MSLTHSVINFNNSEIAFRNKSNAELRQAHLLFKVMNNAGLVKLGKHLVNIAFAVHFPV
ncbi:MAG TPA: proline dehydrogenase, partial [Porphyromonadaceae bacterium]|nr:proline dehydrogenase [Porphyromonadaceae bacterium]